jgi:CRISPR-associated protein Cas2
MVNKKRKTMYYIVVYDIASPQRLPKILKTCRKYLHWVQKSVFEGELTKTQMLALKSEINKIISKSNDSVIFFAIRNTEVIKKESLGKKIEERNNYI